MKKNLSITRTLSAALGVTLLTFGVLFVCLSPAPALAAPAAQSTPDGAALFGQKCTACHTIGGGRLVGPDLAGVTTRRDPEWLKSFVLAPDKAIAAQDPVALQLLAENNNIPMPNLSLSPAEVAALLAYLQNPSVDTAAGQAGPAQGAALPAGDLLAGQRVFRGELRLANGGTPCLACHTVAGQGLLEGGSLGPDLTQVLQRYGEAGLAANLNQITFPTMQGPFLNRPLTPQEQADLIAYFTWSNGQALTPPRSLQNIFLAMGAAGSLLLFGLLLLFWPRQKESLGERLRRQGARSASRQERA